MTNSAVEMPPRSSANCATVATRAPATRSAVTNGRKLFVDGDGRGPWARRWRDLVELHAGDLGGADVLSEAQMSLVRRASTIEIELEAMEGRLSEGKDANLDAYARAAGHLRRILESLGIERAKRDLTPDLKTYLGSLAARAAVELQRGDGVTAPVAIDVALRDPRLLGAAFGSIDTWATWIAVLKAAFGIELNLQERRAFEVVAGGRTPPKVKVRELIAIVGRRGGKSRVAAAVATYIATCIDHTEKLSPGEPGVILVLAASRAQAGVVFAYVRAFLESSPILRGQIETVTAEEIKLRGNIVIAVHSNSFRTIRGRSLVACIFDEAAFWRDETTANPDVETYRAVLPSMASTNGMLICISSPYRRVGLIFSKHRDSFAQEDTAVLVVQGASSLFNPTLNEGVIAAARASDPQAALAEWDAQFRNDLAQFLDEVSIDGAIDRGRPLELAPMEKTRYFCFADMSGGRHDASSLAIVHAEGNGEARRFIADVVRGRRGDPAAATREFAELAKQYGCSSITGDNYSADWVSAAFRDSGREYVRSRLTRSELYLEGLPLFTRGLVNIPDHAQLLRELRLLERRTARSGKDSVDHGIGGSDDHANALFGAMHLAAKPVHVPNVWPIFITKSDLPPQAQWSTTRGYERDVRSCFGDHPGW